MTVTKSVKQHIHGWWPAPLDYPRSDPKVTGQLLKQIVADLEEAGIPLDAELRVEHERVGWKVTGFRLRQENLIQ